MEDLKKIRVVAREAVFPSLCVACKYETYNQPQENKWLCQSCARQLKSSFKTICHVCAKEVALGKNKRCSHKKTYLENVSFIFLYENKIARSLIHALKYRYILDVANILVPFIKKERLNLFRLPADVVLPLPLYKRKLRERGFNQSELLTNIIAETIQKPAFSSLLKKTRPSQAQMKIKHPAERAKNIKDVFKVSDVAFIQNKNVLLVDDVITTGSTLEEAAKTLVGAGAKKVFAFVLARD